MNGSVKKASQKKETLEDCSAHNDRPESACVSFEPSEIPLSQINTAWRISIPEPLYK
jgi:hypothetical protein